MLPTWPERLLGQRAAAASNAKTGQSCAQQGDTERFRRVNFGDVKVGSEGIRERAWDAWDRASRDGIPGRTAGLPEDLLASRTRSAGVRGGVEHPLRCPRDAAGP